MTVDIDIRSAKHLLEGSKIHLQCAFERRRSIRNLLKTKLDAAWKIECESYSGASEVPFKLDPDAKKAEGHTVHLEPVSKDAKAYYPLIYRLEVDGKELGYAEYAVWPATIDVKVTYKHKGDGARPSRLVDGEDKEYADGDPVAGFPFRVQQGTELSEVYYTKKDGTRTVPVALPQVARIVPVTPWAEHTPATSSLYERPRNRTLEVMRHPYAAKIVSQEGGREEDAPFRQYVNCPFDPSKAHGEKMLVRVGAKEDPELAQHGDKIYFKVTFPADNSKRHKPRARVEVSLGKVTKKPESNEKPGEVERVYEGELAVQRNGEASFEIGLGFAGCDRCKIQVGTTKACEDDTLHVKTFRLLEYETWQPKTDGAGAEQLSSWAVSGDTATPGMAPAAKDHLKNTLEAAGVEPTAARESFFTRAQLAAEPWVPAASDGSKRVPSFAGDFFNEAGQKIVVLTWGQINQLLSALSPGPGKRLCQIVYADYVAEREPWFQTVFPAQAGDVVPDKNLLPWNLDGGETITKVCWSAAVDGVWNDWTELTAKEDIDKHAIVRKIDQVELMLPVEAGRADFPGTFIQSKAPKPVTLQVEFHGTGWSWGNINGCALQGVVAMNRYSPDIGNVDPIGVTNVVIHEIGHNMGQTYASAATDPKFGRGSTGELPGIPFPAGVPGGKVYGGKGHQGPHCAEGLSDDDRKSASFGGLPGTCVMFGEDDMCGNAPRTFCNECLVYIKGEDLSDIRKYWAT